MGEKMTLKEAVLQAEPHRMMRGDSGRYPDGTCWGQTSSVDGFWLPLEAWQAITAHLTQPAQAVDVFEPIPEAVDAPTDELWNAYNAFNDRFCGFNTQQALRDAINTVLASRKKRAALPNANGKEG